MDSELIMKIIETWQNKLSLVIAESRHLKNWIYTIYLLGYLNIVDEIYRPPKSISALLNFTSQLFKGRVLKTFESRFRCK